MPGGSVYLKTDSHLLYHYTRESVERWGGCVVAASDMPGTDCSAIGACEAVSAYERAARLRGAAIKYMAFKLN